MKNLITLFLIFSLMPSAFSEDLKFDNDLVDTNYSIVEIGRPLLDRPQSCKTPKATVMGRSQSNLLKFFQNVTCSNSAMEILGDSLTVEQCTMVNQCQEVQKTPLTKVESNFINIEVMDFLIRENVRAELAKYQNKESKDLRDVLAYADKMPEEFKKQVQFCPNYKAEAENCLNEAHFDKAAKSYITSYYSQDEATHLNFRSPRRSSAANMNDGLKTYSQIGAALKTLPSGFVLWKSGMDQQHDTLRSSRIAESVAKKNSSDTDFKSFVKIDKDWSDKVKTNSNSFDPRDDQLLNAVVGNVINDVSRISESELKERVKKAIHKFGIEGNDLILSHNTQAADAVIEKALAEMKFEDKDFTSADRKSLSDKMNALRVKVANGIMASDCSKTVVSLGQMCAKISENLKGGKIKNLPVNDADIFNKMSTSYEATKPNDPFLQTKLSEFKRMGNASQRVYNRYINLMFNSTSCKEKFPGTIKVSKADDVAVAEYLSSTEKFARESKENAYKEIVDIVNNNADLRREFVQSGYKFEGVKRDFSLAISDSTVNRDMPSAQIDKKENSTQNSTDVISSNFKSMMGNENNNTASNNAMANQPIRNFDMGNSDSAAEALKNSANSSLNEGLAEKLKSLEKKESSLSKKIATNNGDDVQDVAGNDELTALRKEIETLKNNQNNNTVSAGSAAADAREKAKNDTSKSIRSNLTVDKLSNNSDEADVESARVATVQARTQAVSQGADYSAESQTTAAATRSPASTGAQLATAGKAGSEKIMTGLVLTKNGDLVGDPSSILENPNEGDIALFMERTKGESFIIRENGELVKISPVLDGKGKPVLTSDGKIKFIKVKLSKAQQELIAKETNVNKAAKEVGVEPVRLFKLKSLLKEVRRD